MEVIFRTENNFCFIYFCINSFNSKLKKLINVQIIIFYSSSNALGSSDKSVQIKDFKHHIFIGMSSFLRNSHRSCSIRKGVLRNSTKFTGKHLCQSLFLIKLQVSACNFIKKETLAQVFFCEFCEISKNTFFIEHLRNTASPLSLYSICKC